ncbi:MAG: hypothetical protein LBE12_19370, partial [Planctomycetaceae bacterium]|nr:hypothetical protein [Planctomycetaceae bacterium]
RNAGVSPATLKNVPSFYAGGHGGICGGEFAESLQLLPTDQIPELRKLLEQLGSANNYKNFLIRIRLSLLENFQKK